jgi:hypothetical protein
VVAGGRSGRILRLELTGAPVKGGRIALVLDPLPNACRLLVLGAREEIIQRFPPPLHESRSGRGQPGQRYAEPSGAFREPWLRVRGVGLPAADLQQASAPDRGKLWVFQPGRSSSEEAERRVAPAVLSPVAPEELIAGEFTLLAGPLPPPQAASEMSRHWIAYHRHHLAHRQIRQILSAERKHMARLLKRLAGEIEEARCGEALRHQAEALLSSPGRVARGATECELPDPRAPGQTLRIELDPKQSFAANAARLFKKAGRLERGLGVRREKAQQAQALDDQMARWAEQIGNDPPTPPDPSGAGLGPHELLSSAASLKPSLEAGLRRRWRSLLTKLRAVAAGLDLPQKYEGYGARRSSVAERRRRPATGPAEEARSRGPTDAAAQRAGIHPRRYLLPEGWLVLVGRTNSENDTLTHRVARQRDLWFHARGVSGSHVILQRGQRKDNPSKEALTQAAGIAAYYSKARTSGMAPVVYTEKRYVRKPRKAPAGLAVCIREKVLMVRPQLPPEV